MSKRKLDNLIKKQRELARKCLVKHKLPEPARLARMHANEVKMSLMEEY